MRIAFDATAILGPMSRNRGIGNYALSQFLHMMQRDPDNEYFFLNFIDGSFHLSEHLLPGTTDLKEEFIDTGAKNVLLREESCKPVIGQILRAYLRRRRIDVFYITSPFESSFFGYEPEWFENTRVVATVYDIIPYVMRDQYLTDPTTRKWYQACLDRLRWADALLVISESVKTDLVTYLQFDPGKIHVIWGAVDDCYREIQIPPEQKTALFQKYDIRGHFIMCTGGEDGRKNLDGLIRAYGLLPETLRQQYQLVVVCKLSEQALARLREQAQRSGVSENVVFTGFVSQQELLEFYNLASLMAFPSKYEGFGLPIVEAWACGTPVLTSNNSSLAQIGADAAVLVDASSDQAIADGMERALQPQLLEELTQRGKQRLERYRWDHVADAAVAVLHAQPQMYLHEVGNDDDPEVEIYPVSERPLAFFTPLPPMQSGISDYSTDILRALSPYFRYIDVFLDSGYRPSVSLPDNVHPLPHGDYPDQQKRYCATLYQMGNSNFHFYMYPYLQRYGGIVVLHDYNLHGSLYHYAIRYRKKDLKCYRSCLLEDYPPEQVDAYLQALSAGNAGPNIYEMEANGFVTNYARKLIVHSQEAKGKLLRRNIARTVQVIPSYTILEPLPDARAAKEALGFSPDITLLAAFGGIHATKRAVPILRAFGMLYQDRKDVRLLFAGKLGAELQEAFAQVIREYGLQDAVTVTGYVTLEQFQAAIDAADICLNLRYPSNGETSGSLMRILGKGKCVVVSDLGSFSELPEGTCVKLPPVSQTGETREPELIAQALRELLEQPQQREALQRAARAYAEQELDLNKVAQQYRAAILSQPAREPVTEQLLETIRASQYFQLSDVPGIARTLARSKQAGRG